ncbi:MAG TPA: hypothetical protein DFS52_12765, partial [Myxococcales bacterium]|nr:hypothetical protein [Myxococcales bacterium]
SLGYQWQVVSAPAGATDPLQGSAAATRTFDAPVPSSLDDPYVIELKVSDGMLESPPARVTLVTDLFEITSVEPAMACVGNVPAQLTLLGNGFLRVNGFEPTVQFAPPGVQASLVSMGGCTQVHPGIESCTELVIEVPFGGDTVGAHAITVTNPAGEACSASAVFLVGPPPFVASVTPAWACEGPSSFAIEGFGFGQTTAVSFNTTPADHLGYLSPFELTAGFDDLAPGLYDVTVSNGAGCSSTRPNAVTILQNPSVYFVDPEVIYSGIFVQATVYVSGINGASVSWLGIRPAGSSGAYQDLPYTYDPLRPNQVQAIIPAGLAAGPYEISLHDARNCATRLASAFTVTDQQTVAIAAIEPPFGWTGAATDVTLLATGP